MVTVIKPPPYDEWEHRITCVNCRAKLCIKAEDIVSDSVDPREPTWHYIVCPVCWQRNTVKPPRGLNFG